VRRFEPGETIALRQTWDGRIWAARPATVVKDAPDQTMLFVPVGSVWMAPFRDGRRLKIPQSGFELVAQRYEDLHVLSFSWPDTWYAVLLFLAPEGSPHSWYVNLEEPLRRTGLGFDTLDHEIDVIVELDGSWRWKDEDDLAEAIRRGVIPAQDEPRMRADGERAVRRVLDREPPFDRDWTTWRPDPSWPVPILPEGWDRV
jgi:predicted RNA-binding protein associated with RNAse of E/G family